jgi:hypothetical protein
MRKLLPFVLAAAAFMAAAPSRASRAAQQQQPDLNASERALVEGSRAAVIATGLTPEYFDRHFRVERVVDRPGDRRVVWRFSVGGHEATVSDSVGFYTEGGRRFDAHSVGGSLNATSDLTRTIPRARAERIMRRCIGRFTNPQVEYRAQGPGGAAALLLTAEAIRAPRGAGERREREERERRERARQEPEGFGRQADAVGEDDEGGGAVVILGAVDLSDGRCTVGRGQAGPPSAPRRGLR